MVFATTHVPMPTSSQAPLSSHPFNSANHLMTSSATVELYCYRYLTVEWRFLSVCVCVNWRTLYILLVDWQLSFCVQLSLLILLPCLAAPAFIISWLLCSICCAGQFYLQFTHEVDMPPVLWRCWLSGRKGIQPVKPEWWGTGVVVCLERDADDLHMIQLMPLPPHHLLL